MKKQIMIIAGIVALSGNANAQWTTVVNDVYKTNTAGNVGVGTTTPGNKLDVVTGGTDDGIKVTQTALGGSWLFLNNTTANGRNWGVLSSGGANNIGGGHYAIYDMTSGTNRFYISGTGISAGNVGIGTTSPGAKLDVSETITGSGGYYGVKGRLTYAGGSNNILTGVDGSTSSAINLYASCVGVKGQGTGGQHNYGGIFNASTTNNTTGRSYGVHATASGAQLNYGGYFTAGGSTSGITTYGVYAEVTNPTAGGTNYGIYATVGGSPSNGGLGPYWAGYFNGDVVTAQGSYLFSDRRLKKDIARIDNSMNIIAKLNPVTYNFDTEGNPYLGLSHDKQFGFISQEVKEILPELTKTIIHPAKLDEKGNEIDPQKELLGLNYNGFIALLTKGMQEQQQQIVRLQNQVNGLLNEKAASSTSIQQANTIDGFALDQNIPNPFSSETVIMYTLPQQVNTASMLVYDLSGKQIASFPITEKGSSSITITSEKLTAGIYIYSVMADGRILDSKRMVVAEKH